MFLAVVCQPAYTSPSPPMFCLISPQLYFAKDILEWWVHAYAVILEVFFKCIRNKLPSIVRTKTLCPKDCQQNFSTCENIWTHQTFSWLCTPIHIAFCRLGMSTSILLYLLTRAHPSTHLAVKKFKRFCSSSVTALWKRTRVALLCSSAHRMRCLLRHGSWFLPLGHLLLAPWGYLCQGDCIVGATALVSRDNTIPMACLHNTSGPQLTLEKGFQHWMPQLSVFPWYL